MKNKPTKLKDNDINYEELKKVPDKAPKDKIDSTVKTLINTPPEPRCKNKADK